MASDVVHHVPPSGSRPGRFVVSVDLAAAPSSPAREAEGVDDEGVAEAYLSYGIEGARRGFRLAPPLPGDEASPSEPTNGTMIMTHTYVPPALRGRRLAERVVEEGFLWARANRLVVDPECEYVADTFLTRRPEFAALAKARRS